MHWNLLFQVRFIPKYRKKVLFGQIRNDVREIIQALCKYKSIEIISGAVCIDHVHLCVSIPPKMKISDFMGYLKGKSTLMLYDRHPEIGSKWDKAFWARGYYVAINRNEVSFFAVKTVLSVDITAKRRRVEKLFARKRPCLVDFSAKQMWS